MLQDISVKEVIWMYLHAHCKQQPHCSQCTKYCKGRKVGSIDEASAIWFALTIL